MTARDPLAGVTTIATPQSQPMPGVANQVRNAAGGYVFDKTLMNKVSDFLILGTSGGTYYVGQDKLTTDNVSWLFVAIKDDGPAVVELIRDVACSRPPRAAKPSGYLFALAACAAKGDPATRQAVKAVFPAVVRTTDHLAKFFGYWKALAGKTTPRGTAPVTGRAMRTALASWFSGDPESVAYTALKGRQRKTPQGEEMALRDIVRIAHPRGSVLTGWLAGKIGDEEARKGLRTLDNFLTAQAVTSPREAIAVIRERGVPWEFLPSQVLDDKNVWAELVATIGLTALIRNLARMTRIGTIAPFAPVNAAVAERLTNAEEISRARIHPMDAWLALRTYASGTAQPDPRAPVRTWTPVPAILDALDVALELSYGNVTPSGKRLLIGVDCSGSMGQGMYLNGSPIGSAFEVANSLAVIMLRTEPNVHVINVDTSVHTSPLTARTTLKDIRNMRMPGGGTNMSLPFIYGTQKNLVADGVIVLTDNETWAGWNHPAQALEDYRRRVNRDARAIVVAMTAAGYSIADPGDEGVLQIAGLDAKLPLLVAGFVR